MSGYNNGNKGKSKGKAAGKGKSIQKGKGKSNTASMTKGYFDVDLDDAVAVLDRYNMGAPPLLDVPVNDIMVQYMSSYNFVDSCGVTPQISRLVVPGLPRHFVGSRSIGTLVPDAADMVADENHLQIPQYPTFPIFAAVRELHPEFDFASLHAVCESNDLRKLLGFMNGDCSPTSILIGFDNERDKSFRLDVDVVNDSCLVLTRCERSDVVPSHFLPMNTFAKNFEEALRARPYLENISSYRIINQVVLGSLILLVRSEIDACDYEDSGVLEVVDTDEWIPTKCPSVQVRRAGAVVERGTMVELKVKSRKSASRIDWAAYYFQMLLAGSGKLVLGIHKDGTFVAPVTYSLDAVRDRTERTEPGRIENDLAKLQSLLHRVLKVARDHGLRQFALFCDGTGGPLVIKERFDEPRVLPM